MLTKIQTMGDNKNSEKWTAGEQPLPSSEQSMLVPKQSSVPYPTKFGLTVLSVGLVLSQYPVSEGSIFGYCHAIWKASGEYLEALWNSFIDIIGEDEFNLWVYASSAVFILAYWIPGSIFTTIDFIKPQMFDKYRIQPEAESINMNRLLRIIWKALIVNQIIIGTPIYMMFFYAMKWRGYPPVREIPTFYWFCAELLVLILTEEAGFYYTHRLFHHPLLYKHIHKDHHLYNSPISIEAIYVSPIDHIFSHLMPVLLGVFLGGCHICIAWFFTICLNLYTIIIHSGYELPFLISAEPHDFHHSKFTDCFGGLGLLDYLHGTDLNFKKAQAIARQNKFLTNKK